MAQSDTLQMKIPRRKFAIYVPCKTRIQNTSIVVNTCVSTATMVTRTLPHVTLYLHSLSFLILYLTKNCCEIT